MTKRETKMVNIILLFSLQKALITADSSELELRSNKAPGELGITSATNFEPK